MAEMKLEFKTVYVQTRDLKAELLRSLRDAGYLESQFEDYVVWAHEDLAARMMGKPRPPRPVPLGRPQTAVKQLSGESPESPSGSAGR